MTDIEHNKWRRTARKRLEENIDNAMARKGLPAVLADIVDSLGTNGYANNMREPRNKDGDLDYDREE